MEEIIARTPRFWSPYRISKGARFRLKHIDSRDTLDLTDEGKPRATEALAIGVEALTELHSAGRKGEVA